jgi:protein SCO1
MVVLFLVAGLLLVGPALARDAAAPVATEWRVHPVDGRLPVIRQAPEYVLTATDGRTVSSADLFGKIRLETFVYTRCQDACPLVSAKLARLQRRLAARRLLGDRVLLASITLDPAHDSPAALARYAAEFGADPRAWLYLRGTPAETRRLRAAYGDLARPGQELAHADLIFLIDGENRVREIYSARLFDPEQALGDVIDLVAAAGGAR